MNNFIFKKYVQFIERNGYFPMMFQPYNCSEVTDISPTITANCGSTTSSAAVLITNLGDEEMNKIRNYSFGNYSPSGHDASRIVDENGVAPTVKENHGTVTAVAMEGKMSNLRIRKLTPKECWRLMGFADEYFYKAEAVNSNTQLYKQAGNSIVVNCIEGILINLFKKG